MLYEELMMDQGMLAKFELFKRITHLRQEDIPIAQLSDELNTNYQQLSIVLTEMNQSLQNINEQQESILQGAGKVNSKNLLVTIDEYRYYLLQNSIPFQYTLYFLNNDRPTIDDFCERYFVSRSTVSRKMLPIKEHLKQFRLRYTYREANIIGDERVVRVALFHVVWLGTRGTVWPFNLAREEAETLINAYAKYFPLSQSYLGKEELAYFFAIFLCRTRKKFFVTYDPQYDFLMENNPYYDFDLLNQVLEPKHRLAAEQSKAESSFIFFSAHYSPVYTVSDDPSLKQAIFDFSNRTNTAFKLNQLFLEYAKQTMFYDQPDVLDNPLIIGNLLNTTFTLSILKQPYPDLQQLIVVPPAKSKADDYLETKISRFFEEKAKEKEFAFIYKVKKSLVNTFKEILAPYYDDSIHSTPLKIGVAFEHHFVLTKKMYQFLNSLDFVEAEAYHPNENGLYDLIISSSLLPLRQNAELPIYFWDLSSNQEDFGHLYKTLQDLFDKKNRSIR